ncbi:MAG: 30S ribosomal protein S8 [Candidatus Pacebacteria bacterium]|nr:30S ribosomal protein S8 [Candidatus Paceibacterota bacterium]
MSDPIGEMITQIRNGYLAGRKKVKVDYSGLKKRLAEILRHHGYLKKISILEEMPKKLVLTLVYKDKEPIMTQIKRISKPGRRLYANAKKIRSSVRSLGIEIISTSQGLMTNRKAAKKNLGGEIVCRIF